MATKNYVGKGWSKTFANGGMVVSMSIEVDRLLALPRDKYGNVRLTAGARKEPDEKSKADWWVAEDDYMSKKLSEETGF